MHAIELILRDPEHTVFLVHQSNARTPNRHVGRLDDGVPRAVKAQELAQHLSAGFERFIGKIQETDESRIDV